MSYTLLSPLMATKSQGGLVAQNLIGSQRWLAQSPAWVVLVVIYFSKTAVLLSGRWFFEGFPYDVSLSSQYGDVALISCILVAQSVIQRQGVGIRDSSLNTPKFHVIVGEVAIATGLAVEGAVIQNSGWQLGQWVDVAHNVLFVPVMIYLLLSTGLVTLREGTRFEKRATWALALIWFLLLLYDVQTGRLNQRDWMRAHGTRI